MSKFINIFFFSKNSTKKIMITVKWRAIMCPSLISINNEF